MTTIETQYTSTAPLVSHAPLLPPQIDRLRVSSSPDHGTAKLRRRSTDPAIVSTVHIHKRMRPQLKSLMHLIFPEITVS